jgi:hypothetical protein
MAGELRRYWSLAATLAAGTGLGPAHPSVSRVCGSLAQQLPCFEASLARGDGTRLSDLLAGEGLARANPAGPRPLKSAPLPAKVGDHQ